MTTDADYIGIIPARSGSKGVRRKNIRTLAGKPLITHTVEAASVTDGLDRTIVTTDDSEIKQIAEKHGAEAPFRRPAELATDEAAMEPVVKHAITYLKEKEDYTSSAVVLLQPTSPLRTASLIDRAIERHRNSEATTVVSVSEDHSYRWRPREDSAEQVNYTGDVSRRQDKTPEYVENGAIYIVDTDHFLTNENLRGGTVELFEMSERRSLDIDTEFEFWLAEQIMQYLNNEAPEF